MKGDVIEVDPPEEALQVRILELDENSSDARQLLVGHLPKDSEGKLYFKSPKTVRLDNLRFEWISHDPFPFSFYQGRSNFDDRLTIDSEGAVAQFSAIEESVVLLDDFEKWETDNESFRQNAFEEEISIREAIADIDEQLLDADASEIDELLQIRAEHEEYLENLSFFDEFHLDPFLSEIEIKSDFAVDYLSESVVTEPLLLRSSALSSISAFQTDEIDGEALETTEISDIADTVDEDIANSVEETDIWDWAGEFLYFFNQKRGLQIIDLSDPEVPEVVAQYRQPASGEEMYVSDDGSLIYLIINHFYYEKSKLKILKFQGGQITEQSETLLPGNYRESRLIGNSLHLVCEEILESDYNYYWRSWDYDQTTNLISLDISDPKDPQQIFEETIAGGPEVLFANHQYLVVITSDLSKNYYQSHVAHTFSLGDDVIPFKKHSISIGGRVGDKFKIHTNNGVLTVVSQAENDWSIYSLLENFDLETGELLGSLDIAEEETLYATRFKGNYAYIVTFLRVDPLFIIDLSIPEEPQIISELKVPGWSEYLQVFNDQLFAIGTEDNVVTASLFDISDKKKPLLSSRIFLGEEFGYSSSEANYDEKAIGQIPELGLFLIPFQTHSFATSPQEDEDPFLIYEDAFYPTPINAVQILQLSEDELIERGQIDHAFQSRRATTDKSGKYLFSISAEELVVSEISNLDAPRFLTKLQLAWDVDLATTNKEFLFQFTQSDPYNDRNATLILSPIEKPDQLLGSYDLGNAHLLGSLADKNMLHFAHLEDDHLVATVMKFDGEGNLIETANSKVPLIHQLSHYNFILFKIGEDQVCWASELTREDLFFYTDLPEIYYLSESVDEGRRLAISDEYYSMPEPKRRSQRLLGEIHLLTFENNNSELTLNHLSSTSIERGGDFLSASGPFRSGNQILYGLQAEFDRSLEHQEYLKELIHEVSFEITLNQETMSSISENLYSIQEELIASKEDIDLEELEESLANIEEQLLSLEKDYHAKETFLKEANLSLPIPQFYKSSKLLRYDLTDTEIQHLSPLNSPGKIIGSNRLDITGESSILYFENDNIETGNFVARPSYYAYLDNFENFVQSIAACSYDGTNIYLLDETSIPNLKAVTIGEDFIFITTMQEDGDLVAAYSVDINTGEILKQFNLFENHDSLSYKSSSHGNYMVSFSDDCIYIFDGNYIWNKIEPELPSYHFSQDWFTSGSSLFFPVWQYGIEILSSEEDSLSTPHRRSEESSTWQEVPETAISIFAEPESPQAFSTEDFKEWKFRPNTKLDQSSEILAENWKDLGWFGSFYDRSYPWIFHTKLGWIYHHHESHSEGFWIWHDQLDWVWTSENAFPYFYSDSHKGWIYINLTSVDNENSFYSFKDEEWFSL